MVSHRVERGHCFESLERSKEVEASFVLRFWYLCPSMQINSFYLKYLEPLPSVIKESPNQYNLVVSK